MMMTKSHLLIIYKRLHIHALIGDKCKIKLGHARKTKKIKFEYSYWFEISTNITIARASPQYRHCGCSRCLNNDNEM